MRHVTLNYNKINRPGVAIHCKTKVEALELTNWAADNKFSWRDGTSYRINNPWQVNGWATMFSIYEGTYGRVDNRYEDGLCTSVYALDEVRVQDTY